MKIINYIEKLLLDAGIEEAKAEARYIVTEISGQTLAEIILNDNVQNKEKIIDIAKKRISTKMPIQYILGYSYFMGNKYHVNKDVLIPRDETELLVREIQEILKNKKNKLNILEIGVGCGCISIETAKKLYEKDIEILAVDISLDAIKTALENADRLGVIRKVIFRKSDIYSKIRVGEKFDLIVSNPPYIPIKEKNTLQIEVKNFEPDIALYAPDEDGILFYKKIIQDAKKFLKQDGYLVFEVGINQSEKVKKLLLENNFKDIRIIKDLAGIERVLIANC